jgi:hypothetical protein
MTPEEGRAYQQNFADSLPWVHGVTDKEGQADIDLTNTCIDRTSGAKPPPDRDIVTGKPYLLKMKARKSSEKQFPVLMKCGVVVKEESYTIIVIDIQDPRYIERRRTPVYGETAPGVE